jgi:predicted DNA-binding ribbon-helix-helix protein
MHRTQVILDERHYAFLKKKAEQEKKSISQVLREILDNHTRRSSIYSLLSLAGIAEDTECYGRDHDKWLYGKK